MYKKHWVRSSNFNRENYVAQSDQKSIWPQAVLPLGKEVKENVLTQWFSHFLTSGLFIFLKIIEDVREVLFMWVITINIFSIRN